MNGSNKLFKPFADDPDSDGQVETNLATRNLVDYLYPGVENNAQLRNYWRAIRKHIWLILATVLLVTALMIVYMARKPDIYEAYAQVQIDVENNSAFGTSKSGPILVSSGSDPAYFNTQLRVLNSSGLLGRVVETLDLQHNQAFRQRGAQSLSTTESVLRMLGARQIDKRRNPAQTSEQRLSTATVAPAASRSNLEEAERVAPFVEAIRRYLRVEPVKESRAPSKETRLIELRYQHSNPDIAAKIVNTIVETFALTNLEKQTETNTSAGEFLQKRIAELQGDIRSGEERLARYADSNQILSLNPQQNTVVDRLVALNNQLLAAENARKEAEAIYKSRLTPGAAEAEADSGSRSDAAESKLGQLQQRREELLVEDTEESPTVVAIDRQIAVLQKQITDSRQRAIAVVVTNLDTNYRAAQAREQALRSAFEQQRDETQVQNRAAINYRIIEQEVETQKELLGGLIQRSKENDIMLASLAGTPNNVRVLDYALVPKNAIGPKRWLNVGMVSAVALVLSIGLAIFLGYLDDTVHSSDEVESMLHLPALAVVPAVGGFGNRRLLTGIGKPLHLGKRRKSETPLVTADPRSPLAEAYRRLRTSILLSTAGHPPKTLLVTSSLPDEGKTTTAVNMALTLANSGDKVLIIDADMHRPSLQVVFKTDNYAGLSSCLVKEPDEAELNLSIKQYEDTSLHILTAGPVPPNPAELLGSQQMHDLVGRLEEAFDYIVIDSPPITYFTDGVLLTAVVDGVLLVVNSGSTSREIVQRSCKVLRDVNARVFGVVLNNVDIKSQEYSY